MRRKIQGNKDETRRTRRGKEIEIKRKGFPEVFISKNYICNVQRICATQKEMYFLRLKSENGKVDLETLMLDTGETKIH